MYPHCCCAGKISESFPVIVTTYEIIMKDISFFMRFHFKSMIVDEGHRLKNHKCKLIRQLREINAANKVLLTGKIGNLSIVHAMETNAQCLFVYLISLARCIHQSINGVHQLLLCNWSKNQPIHYFASMFVCSMSIGLKLGLIGSESLNP